jgi:hypothetical protein
VILFCPKTDKATLEKADADLVSLSVKIISKKKKNN